MKIDEYTTTELRELADAVDALSETEAPLGGGRGFPPYYLSDAEKKAAEAVADFIRWAVGDAQPTQLLDILTNHGLR